MKVAVLSDIHGQWHDLRVPECDVLIVPGDYSGYHGGEAELRAFILWLNKQPATHKIVSQGNHEVWVEDNVEEAKRIAAEAAPNVHFVFEERLEIEGVTFWCSPVTPWFNDWAWNVQRGEAIKAHWDKIPDETDVLVTHGPPYGILDAAGDGREHLGCYDLLKRIERLPRLKLHVFGHIHGGAGECTINNVRFINGSVCNEQYEPVNNILVFDLPQPLAARPLPAAKSCERAHLD